MHGLMPPYYGLGLSTQVAAATGTDPQTGLKLGQVGFYGYINKNP